MPSCMYIGLDNQDEIKIPYQTLVYLDHVDYLLVVTRIVGRSWRVGGERPVALCRVRAQPSDLYLEYAKQKSYVARH